jgi:membrane-associated protease RseP (regulator of RpoE activity)
VTSWGCLSTIFVAFMIAIAVAGFAAAARRRKREEEAPLRPTRLSALAAMSFFCGMTALLVLVSASIVSLVALHGEALRLSDRDRQLLRAAAEVALLASLAPAAGALAFALGARGAIRESREGLRGAALSRAGVLLGLITGFFALGGKAAVVDRFEGERGYLGVTVQVEPANQFGERWVRIVSVDESGPAAAAGLRAGDRISHLDGKPAGEGAPFSELIRSRRPGTRVRLDVDRGGGEALSVEVELGRLPPRLEK